MNISIIVATSRNGVIGANGNIPWHLPEDLKYFQRNTLHKPVIMGRKTYESIGRPLRDRINIVVTRQEDWSPAGVFTVQDLSTAITTADAIMPGKEIMVAGGGEIYTELLPYANKVYLTEVDMEVEGDTFFPKLDPNKWEEVSRETGEGCEYLVHIRKDV